MIPSARRGRQSTATGDATEDGCLRLHVVDDIVAAVIWLCGEPWCAVTELPGRGWVLAFKENR